MYTLRGHNLRNFWHAMSIERKARKRATASPASLSNAAIGAQGRRKMPIMAMRDIFSPDALFPAAIKKGLKTSCIGREVFHYLVADSTNLTAKKLVRENVPEGTIVIAEEQSAGRGRLDRKWLSAGGKNLLFTVIFRPQFPPTQVFRLTMITSLAVARTIRASIGIPAFIKWPNDIFINNKKVCGILTEFSVENDRVAFALVGVGINVNFDPGIYPEIKDIATSLSRESGKEIARLAFFRNLLQSIDEGYLRLKEGKVKEIRDEWESLSLVKGKPVKISSLTTEEEGIAEAIDEDGSLILQTFSGERKKIVCGDLSLVSL